MLFKRIHLIVLDSVGIGEAPDADVFGDSGSDTLGHIAESTPDFSLPHLIELGLTQIRPLGQLPIAETPIGHWAKLQEVSAGKDTMTGHWELMGLRIDEPFRVFPDGFPEELIEQIETFAKRPVIVNRPMSGTQVIEEYGAEHLKTGALIVYTSADSVLQIAAHEEVVPIDELYRICQYVRSITLEDPYMIGRIIARPFIGTPGAFERTSRRHDYALDPFGETALDRLKAAGYTVSAVGKINDIFNGHGITETVSTESNDDGVDQLLKVMRKDFTGLSFTNLVDFDAKYGHRRDVPGYAQALEAFDRRLPEIYQQLKQDDLLLITADHGNDPTAPGTDHTREFVPLLAYHSQLKHPQKIMNAKYFYDLAATIEDNFKLPQGPYGQSFLSELE